ncbi:hypothetical protein MEN98_26310, partial [Dolichospermum sp. ST_sed8]|nr:hypothetical protein [Dolichospermum sp. ST_sed8]
MNCAKSQDNTPNFDELLIADLKQAINLLEEDVLYQLQLSLEEYNQYCQAKYLPNSIDKINTPENETITKNLEDLRNKIKNHLRVYGVLEVEEFSDAGEKLIEFAEKPQGSIHDFEQIFLDKLKNAQARKQAQKD